MTLPPSRVLACVGALAVVILLLREFSRPSVAGDGIRHYAPLASLIFDHDLDQSNEFMHADPSIRRRWLTSPEGALINPYPVGTAVLWAPVIGIAWLLDPKKSTYGDPDRWRFSSPAFSRRYLVALAIGTGLQTLGGMALLYRLLRLSVDFWDAGLAVAAVTLGTPLVYYALAMPSYSHAASFFACAALLTSAFSTR